MLTKQLSKALTETLENNSLQNLTTDLSEIAIDDLIKEGLLKDIPIINTLLNIKRGISLIQEQIFLKKIISFLSMSKDITPSDRKRMINEINSSKKHRIKVGEKLLYIIDRCEDCEMSEIISIFFNEVIKGKISYEEFIKIAKLMERITIYDLKKFQSLVKNNKSKSYDKKYYLPIEIDDLINSGLFIYYTDELFVEDEDDWKMNRKYKTEGGELKVEISEMGNKVNEILTAYNY